MKFIEIYKEIYKEILLSTKTIELETIIHKIEKIDDDEIFEKEELLNKIESFTKPYPIPLFLFSFLGIFKICLTLKKNLNQNYDFYLKIYNDLRKKENLNEEESKLFFEVGEILYRINDLDHKSNKALTELLINIKKIVNENLNKSENNIFLIQINNNNYYEVYPYYEKLIDIILTYIDEKKLEKGLYKLCTMLLNKEV